MDLRGAEPDDLETVAHIATDAWWDSFVSLLKPETIEAVLTHTYSTRALQHRWEDHPMLLVIDHDQPVAFAEAFIEDQRIVLCALFVTAGYRGKGAGSMLLEKISVLDPRLPVTSDVLLGARSAEAFYETHGFVPGETMKSFLYGEPIVERRWWKEPAAA